MPPQFAATRNKPPVLRKIIHLLSRKQKTGVNRPSPQKIELNKNELSPHLRRDLGLEPTNYTKRQR